MLPTLAMLLLVALFSRLAVWQYHRGHERAAKIAAVKAAAKAAPVTLNPYLKRNNVDRLPRFAHVRLIGRYDARHQVLLDEISHKSEVGYDVLTPFVTPDHKHVLVNRGWIPGGAQRKPAGNLSPPHGKLVITGHLASLPKPGIRLGAGHPGKKWPKVLLYPSLRRLGKLLGYPLPHRIVLLSPKASGGYVRDWNMVPTPGPERNYGYMFQWIALAFAVFVTWLVVNLRRGRRPDRG